MELTGKKPTFLVAQCLLLLFVGALLGGLGSRLLQAKSVGEVEPVRFGVLMEPRGPEDSLPRNLDPRFPIAELADATSWRLVTRIPEGAIYLGARVGGGTCLLYIGKTYNSSCAEGLEVKPFVLDVTLGDGHVTMIAAPDGYQVAAVGALRCNIQRNVALVLNYHESMKPVLEGQSREALAVGELELPSMPKDVSREWCR